MLDRQYHFGDLNHEACLITSLTDIVIRTGLKDIALVIKKVYAGFLILIYHLLLICVILPLGSGGDCTLNFSDSLSRGGLKGRKKAGKGEWRLQLFPVFQPEETVETACSITM